MYRVSSWKKGDLGKMHVHRYNQELLVWLYPRVVPTINIRDFHSMVLCNGVWYLEVVKLSDDSAAIKDKESITP